VVEQWLPARRGERVKITDCSSSDDFCTWSQQEVEGSKVTAGVSPDRGSAILHIHARVMQQLDRFPPGPGQAELLPFNGRRGAAAMRDHGEKPDECC